MSLFNFRTTFIFVIASVVALTIWFLVVERDEKRANAEATLDAHAFVTTMSTSLELALERRLTVFSSVKTFTDHLLKINGNDLTPEMKLRMKDFVDPQIVNIPGIRNFSLAPDGKLAWICPEVGNEAALGHDLFNDPYPDVSVNIQRALTSGERIISGPYRLRQGGLGMIVRQAIYADNKVWGLISMVIDIPSLLKASHIEFAHFKYRAGLRTNYSFQFWGAGSAFSEHAEISRISLPDGYWELGVVPNDRILQAVANEALIFKISVAAFLVIVLIFLFFFLHRQRILEKEVSRKTSAVLASEDRFKKFAESASDWFWESNEKGRLIYCSERFFEFTGADPLRMGEFDFRIIPHPTFKDSDSQRWDDFIQIVEKQEPFKNFEYHSVRADKEVIHFSISGTPIFGDDGAFQGYQGTGVDITSRKLAEEANKTYAELFTRWKTSNFIGIVQCDTDGVLLDINDTMLAMIGYERHEVIDAGFNCHTLTPKEFHHLDQQARDEATEFGYWTAYEKELLHKDGHRVPVLIGGSQYKARPDEFIQFVLDISEQKKTESVLAEATQKAEAATNIKSEFLAAMSHEIRTPMAGIVGMAELLVTSELSPKQKKWARNVYSSGQTLLKILNEILDQSKLEAGKLEIAPTDFHLPTLVHEITGLFEPTMNSKGLSLILDFEEDLPGFVFADRMRIGQILSNLLSNALKFTESGEVVIKVSNVLKKPNDLTLYFEVTDSGIGLTDEEVSRLFIAFSQADSSTSRIYGGTGLGLSISQKLAKLMRGDIGVKSSKGQGSTFWFKLQCHLSDGKNIQLEKVIERGIWQASRPLRILLADDNRINQQLIEAIFYNLNHDLTTVEDGAAVIDCVAEQDFDIILMDVRMPNIDGVEAAKTIRSMSCEKSNIPIIGITADLASGNIRNYIRAGMNEVCTKPIEMSVLLGALNSQMNEEIHTLISDDK